MSAEHKTASEVARQLGEEYSYTVRPRDISALIYNRELREDLVPLIGGRRMIAPEVVPVIATLLQRKGKLPRRVRKAVAVA